MSCIHILLPIHTWEGYFWWATVDSSSSLGSREISSSTGGRIQETLGKVSSSSAVAPPLVDKRRASWLSWLPQKESLVNGAESSLQGAQSTSHFSGQQTLWCARVQGSIERQQTFSLPVIVSIPHSFLELCAITLSHPLSSHLSE